MSVMFRRGQKVCRRDDPSRIYIVVGQSGSTVDVSIVDGAYRRYTTINAEDLVPIQGAASLDEEERGA